MNDASWHLVRSMPRVMGFIGGTSDRPASISDKEVDAIMNRLQQVGDKPRPKTLFEPGELVRVNDGPLPISSGRGQRSRLREEPPESFPFPSSAVQHSGGTGLPAARLKRPIE